MQQKHTFRTVTHTNRKLPHLNRTHSHKMADTPATTGHHANQSPCALVAALPLSSGMGPMHQSPSWNRVSWQPQVKPMTISSKAMRRSRHLLMTSERMTWVTAIKIRLYGGTGNTGFNSKNKVLYLPRQEKITCCNWSRQQFSSVDPFYDLI